jgi:hypothetical protein
MLLSWACFGLILDGWFSSEKERCIKFGDLAAECLAPQYQEAFGIGIVFVIAVMALAWLAIRPSRTHPKP